MSRRPNWCDRLEPTTAMVTCNGERHRITWQRGKLVLEAHDLAAETAMQALGDQPCTCMRALKLWRDQWAVPPEVFRHVEATLGELALPELAPVRELAMVRNWDRTWRRSAYLTKHGTHLLEQVRSRAMGPLREHLAAWARRLGYGAAPRAEVELVRGDGIPSMVGTMDRAGVRARASLSPRWLFDVWLRRGAVVEGAFVLEVLGPAPGPGALETRAVRWQAGGDGPAFPVVAPATLAPGGEGWTLSWDERPG